MMTFNPYNAGTYNITPPTLTDGQQSSAQLDVNGNVKVAVSAASLPLPSNAAQETGGNLATVAGAVSGTLVTSPNYPKIVQDGTAVSSATGTTLTFTFANSVKAGNAILVFASASAGAAPSVSDGVNTYATLASSTNAPGFILAIAQNIAAGSTTVTITASSGSIALAAYEVSGTAGVGSPYDYIVSGSVTGNPFNTQVAPSQANNLVFDFIGSSTTVVNWRGADGLIQTSGNPFPFTMDANNLAPVGGAALSHFYAWHIQERGFAGYSAVVNMSSSVGTAGATIALRGIAPVTVPNFAVGTMNGFNYGTSAILSQTAASDGQACYVPFTNNAQGAPAGVGTYKFTSGSAFSSVLARTPNIFKTIAAVAVTAGTPVAIWTPAAGKKFRLMGFMLSLTVAGSVILDDSATEIIRTPLMAAGVGQSAPPMGNGILSAAANNILKADVSASGSVSGFVYGTEE
ncbi:MAG: hypothetical protein ACRD2O_00165 [Terriglobia bacterium]